jgi:hypothetical protein
MQKDMRGIVVENFTVGKQRRCNPEMVHRPKKTRHSPP